MGDAGMNRPTRVVALLLVAVAVVWLLFTVVFPWFDRTFVSDPVLGVAAGVLRYGTGDTRGERTLAPGSRGARRRRDGRRRPRR